MSWITVVWSMNAAACLTLAAIYFVVWCKQRGSWMYFAFSCSAVAGAALTAFELALLRANTVEQYSAILRWAQFPVWALVVSLVIFVRLYLRAGRRWLAWSVCGLRTLALILNFVLIPNLSYRKITGLRQVSWWSGEMVVAPVGATNPWILVAQLSSLLLIVFFVDATITVWRRGKQKRGLGIVLSVFSLIAAGQALLVVWGIIQVPFLACFAILGLLVVMGYELSNDIFRAAYLARELSAKEKTLREFEQRVSLATEAAQLGVWELNTETNEVWISDGVRRIFQFQPNVHVTYAMFEDRVHPEDRPTHAAAVQNAIKTQGGYEVEYRTLLPDKRVRWISGRARCVSDPSGKLTRLLGVSMDVTERKHAQDLFRLATEASPNGVLMVNDQGHIVLVNANIEELFGYKRDELIGQPVEILVPDRLAAGHPSYRSKFLLSPEARPMGAGRELFACRKDGSEFPVEIGLTPIHAPEGVLILAAVVDISRRKEAEEEARRRRAQIDLLSRVSLLGEMTASLAHELNQPLAAIATNANAAIRFINQGKADPERLCEILADVVADGHRAHEIIHNVRNTIKKGGAIRQLLDMNEIVLNVAHMVQPDAWSSFCKVKTLLAKNLPTIKGDPIQMQEVLINLIGNAFQAMRDVPVDEREVEVSTQRNGNNEIIISVRDHGVGMTDDVKDRLFEQFFTTKEEGLGMGLAIVRSIIETHSGTIVAENADGGGARFSFTLPASN